MLFVFSEQVEKLSFTKMGEVCGNHGLEENIKKLAFRYFEFKVLIRYPKGE